MKLTGKIADEGFESVSGERYGTGPHKIPRLWIMVADQKNARVFSRIDGQLVEISVATPAEHGRPRGLPNRDIGRVVSSAAGTIHHGLAPHATQDEKETLLFAQDIAVWLEKAVAHDAFDQMVLVATPHMLGNLRSVLGKPVNDRVIAEIDKDLTKMSERDLYEKMKNVLLP